MTREVYFVDSMNGTFFPQFGWRYDPFGHGSSLMGPAFFTPGGGTLIQTNSGFHSENFTKFLGTRNQYAIGFNWSPQIDGPGIIADCIFLRWEVGPGSHDLQNSNPNTQLSLATNAAGNMILYNAGTGAGYSTQESLRGTRLWTSTRVFTAGTVYYVELEVTFGLGGFVRLVIDDVEEVSFVANVGQGAVRNPDRFTIRLQNLGGGYRYGDLYVANEQLGPCRVVPLLFTDNAAVQGWAPKSSTNLSQISDHLPDDVFGDGVPDGDKTYVESSAAGATDMYFSGPPPCFGLVLAVALNCCSVARAGTPGVNFMLQQPGLLTTLGSVSVPAAAPPLKAYQTDQAIAQINPKTGVEWIDREIQIASWGYQMAGSGTVRLTAAWLEKLVSLRAVPFTCGIGSYAY